MKYTKLLIKTKVRDAIQLQKHLFWLRYAWVDSGNRHRTIKIFDELSYGPDLYIGVGKSADMFYHLTRDIETIKENAVDIYEYKIVTYEQLMRKEKIIKIEQSDDEGNTTID